MIVVEYAAAALVAAAVSSALLWQRHRRGPLGGLKATLWWGGIMAVDAGVAALCLLGAFGLDDNALDGTSGVLRAAGIGLLGPLGLRSPVTERRIHGRVETIGPTYVYDLLRINMEHSLYERMTHLRRRDRIQRTAVLTAKGWGSQALANRLDEHFDQMEEDGARDESELARLRRRLTNALSPPDESDKLKALVDLAITERFWSVLQECGERPPSEWERRTRQPAGEP